MCRSVSVHNSRTNTHTTIDRRRGAVSAILFGEIMAAARGALELEQSERAHGLAEAGEILSGIPCAVLLSRLA